MIGVDDPYADVPKRPVVGDESGMTDDEKDFWEWFKGKLDGVKDWWGELVGSEKVKTEGGEGG
jgi:hypothetical protein